MTNKSIRARKPICPSCGSGLLALLNKSHGAARSIILKNLQGNDLTDEEVATLQSTGAYP
jgi:hypothetical protein